MRFKRNAFPSFHRVTNLSRDTTGGGGWMKYSKVLYITNSPFTRDKAGQGKKKTLKENIIDVCIRF